MRRSGADEPTAGRSQNVDVGPVGVSSGIPNAEPHLPSTWTSIGAGAERSLEFPLNQFLQLPAYNSDGDGDAPDRTAAQSEIRALGDHVQVEAAPQKFVVLPCGTKRQTKQPYMLSGVPAQIRECSMNNVIYLVGLVVVVLAILSFLGIR